MKFELIAALLHRPQVLFLDEPTIGLDVVSQKTVREFLGTYNRTFGTTILLTSHYMADIEAVCDRTIIIDNGSLVYDGQLSEIIDRFADYRFLVVTLPPNTLPHIESLPAEVMEFVNGRLRLKVSRENFVPVCRALLDRHLVEDLEIHEISAEEVVRDLFSRDKPAATPLLANAQSSVAKPALACL